ELEAPSRVSLLEDASVSGGAGARKRQTTTAGVGLGVFLAVLLGVGWLELRSGRIGCPTEVHKDLKLRLVGALPCLPRRRTLVRLGADGSAPADHHLLMEAVDATRALVVHAARSESLRAVMVSSAVSGEGKTSLAAHLAASLARAGFRTLLVDADLRRPSLHRVYEVPQAGLSEALRGALTLAEAAPHTPP